MMGLWRCKNCYWSLDRSRSKRDYRDVGHINILYSKELYSSTVIALLDNGQWTVVTDSCHRTSKLFMTLSVGQCPAIMPAMLEISLNRDQGFDNIPGLFEAAL